MKLSRTLQLLFFLVSPVVLGICAGSLTLMGMLQIMLRFIPPSEVEASSRLVVGVSSHAIIALSSFAAGVAAAWNQCWSAKGPKGSQLPVLGGQYGISVALALFVAATYILIRGALLVWPLFLVDLVSIAFAGVVGHRISNEYADVR